MNSTGKIKFYNIQKGYGFITPDSGGKDLFVHVTNVQCDPKLLKEGQTVSYKESVGKKGPEAIEVSID